MTFNFPVMRSRYQLVHASLGSCELVIYNDPDAKGISARVFPQGMEQVWYLPASEGAKDTEEVLSWLILQGFVSMTDSKTGVQTPPMVALTGHFHVMEYCQLVVLDKKEAHDGYQTVYTVTLLWPMRDDTITVRFTLASSMWMSYISEIYPGCKIHRSELAYHEWLEARAQSALAKRNETLSLARQAAKDARI